MSLYFIEMGQGIIARPEVRVITSCLSSCSLLTGWSQKTRFGGAFHYPGGYHDNAEVLAAMALWVFYLKPTAIKILFARGVTQELGTKKPDRDFLKAWVTRESGLIPSSAPAIGARMRLTTDLEFSADDGRNLPDLFDSGVCDVSKFPAGDYSAKNYILVGRNMA